MKGNSLLGLGRELRFVRALAVGVVVASSGCVWRGGVRSDSVAMIEAACGSNSLHNNLMLQVRKGERWRVEFAFPDMSRVYTAGGNGRILEWRSGSAAWDERCISGFMALLDKLLLELRSLKEGAEISRAASATGMAVGASAELDDGNSEVYYDTPSRLPKRVISKDLDQTNYYWRIGLTACEWRSAFRETNSMLRIVLLDGRVRDGAPHELVNFIRSQERAAADAEAGK